MIRRFVQDYFLHVSGIWKKNWPGFLRQYRLLLILAALASLADCLTTVYFMVYNSDLTETHPVVRYMSIFLGPFVGPILGKFLQFAFLIGVAAFLRRWAVYILSMGAFLYFYAAWYNIWGYKLYTPLFLRVLEPVIQI